MKNRHKNTWIRPLEKEKKSFLGKCQAEFFSWQDCLAIAGRNEVDTYQILFSNFENARTLPFSFETFRISLTLIIRFSHLNESVIRIRYRLWTWSWWCTQNLPFQKLPVTFLAGFRGSFSILENRYITFCACAILSNFCIDQLLINKTVADKDNFQR